MPRLLLTGVLVVLAHFGVVIWHILLLVKVQPSTPGFALVLLIAINLVPVVALIAFAKGWPKLAGSMILLPFAVALVIGAYTHFLSPGSDNVLRMPSGEFRLPFQVSSVLLVVLEALGCWVGVRMLATPTVRMPAKV